MVACLNLIIVLALNEANGWHELRHEPKLPFTDSKNRFADDIVVNCNDPIPKTNYTHAATVVTGYFHLGRPNSAINSTSPG